jgi:hypothetical protein
MTRWVDLWRMVARALGGFFFSVMVTLGCAGAAFGAHPLITDDTGTQGEGKSQVEVNGEYSHDRENGVTEDAFEASTIISYGLLEPVDLVLTVPYQRIRTKEAGRRNTEEGISDLVLELKWRFWEDEDLGLSFAVKPGMTFPTGDHERGLGVGRPNATLFFIATEKLDPLAFHLNLGYMRNENKLDERTNLWHASLATELEILEGLKAVANIGIERNPDKESNTDPAFILGGFIYSVSDWLDLDIGVKGGLTRPEADYTVMAGLTVRF